MSRHWLDEDMGDDVPVAGPSRARRVNDQDDAMGDDQGPAILPQEIAEQTPFQQLLRHWMNERHAPDILPAQEYLLGRLLDHISKQTSDVQLLRADPATSEDEHFRIMLVQTEIERVKFVIRSYIRTRLHKIEKYARYISTTREMHERLSRAELEHTKGYAKLTESHFTNAILQNLPEEQRGLDDQIPFLPPMISKPDKTKAVFVHALHACGPVRLSDGNTMDFDEDQISLIPYEVIENLLLRGEVELV